MSILRKLDELISEHGKPKIAYVNHSFFMEILLEEFVKKDPIRYNLINLLDTVNVFPYLDIIIINEFKEPIIQKYDISYQLIHSIKENIAPTNLGYCVFIFSNTEYTLLEI